MESVSALVDGELDSAAAVREITKVKQDSARRDAWDTYHAIGDAMRGERATPAGMSAHFSRCLSERLALEPTVVAPRLRVSKTQQSWALAAAASVAAIAVVGWMAPNMLNPEGAPVPLAQAPIVKPPVVTLQSAPAQPQAEPTVAPVAMVPEHVHEYLLAHQGISPTTAIQGVTPYIRTVSNVGDAPDPR